MWVADAFGSVRRVSARKDAMATAIEICAVEPATIDREGFFCRKSKMKTAGNRRKLQWATEQMGDGLGIEILYEDGRSKGFVEYTPGVR